MPKDADRLGPAPPPPPTAHRPGLSVHAFRGEPGLTTLAESSVRRPGRTLVLRGPRPEPVEGLAAALALSEARLETGAGDALLSAGDLFFAGPGAAPGLGRSESDAALLLEVSGGIGAAAHEHVRREELSGRPFPGVTGIRAVRRTPSTLAVRLGPPPGARWVLVGLRAFAVFHGKLIVVDGDEALEVKAGELGVVAEPTATLYLSAGNDAALAIGFASPDLVVALG